MRLRTRAVMGALCCPCSRPALLPKTGWFRRPRVRSGMRRASPARLPRGRDQARPGRSRPDRTHRPRHAYEGHRAYPRRAQLRHQPAEVSGQAGFTTILQQAGSIAVEAEKKDHKHFEVLTPYLAAVVKGTQFTVTVGKGASDVNVAAGKVEVADVKTGKTALVLPGQFAKVGATAGLTLGGSGTFEPITQGAPRTSLPPPSQCPARASPRRPPSRMACASMRLRRLKELSPTWCGLRRLSGPSRSTSARLRRG